MSGVSNPETEALTTGKRGSKLVKVAAALLVLVVVLAGGVFFAGPMIGASVAKSAIARTTEDGTTVTVESVSLSWGGPQRVRGVNLHTTDGHDAAVDATLDASLFSLIASRGKGDLGTATVTGTATLNADALNAEPSTAPDAPSDTPTDLPEDWTTGGPKAIELGSGFAITLDVQRIDLNVISAQAPAIVGVLTANATAQAGQPTQLNATLEMTPEGQPTGTATLRSTLTGLIGPSGTVNTDAFETETNLVIDQLATGLVGLVQRGAGIPGVPADLDLARALGPTIAAELSTTARLGDDPWAQTTLMLTTANVRLVSHTSLAAGRLTSTGDNALEVNTAELEAAWPAFADWLATQGLGVAGAPELTLMLDALDWPTTTDYRTTQARASVSLTQTGLTLPAGTLGEQPAAVEISPTRITVTLDGDSLTLNGTVRSTIDQTPAGVVDLDLRVEQFLSAIGSPPAILKTISGEMTMTDVPAALMQPLLAAGSPVQLARDLGPTITATLAAQSTPGQMTLLAVDARADNVTAKGSFTIDGSLVQNQPAADTRVTINRLSPTLAGILGDAPPATLLSDSGAVLMIQMMSLDLDALKEGGLFGPGTLRVYGDYRVAPLTARLTPSEQPVSLNATSGTYSVNGPQISTITTLGGLDLGSQPNAVTGVTVETTTTMPGAASDGSPETTSKLVARVIQTKALGEWLGAESGAGAALARLDGQLRLESEPTLRGGVIEAPFAIDGQEFDITGAVASDAGVLTGEILVDITDTAAVDAAMGLAQGLAGELLGSSTEVRLSLLPPAGGTLNALASITSERLETNGRVRVVADNELLSIPEPFTMHARLTPRAFALLAGDGDLTIDEPADVTIQLEAFNLPKAGAQASSLSVDASFNTGPLLVRRTGEPPRAFSGLSAKVRSDDALPERVMLLASLNEEGRPVLNADLTASGLRDDSGAFAPAGAGLTGTVSLAQAQTELLDMVAGSNVLSNLLGPTTDADLRLTNFPLDGGTLTGTVAGARATGSIDAVSSQGTVSLAQPARFELREITQNFSYQFSPLLPIIGALTKDPATDRPATVTLETLAVPVKFDVTALSFEASIDVGTASIMAENDLTAMLRGRPTIGNRFAPFNASMTDGVLSVTGLTVPIGEFMVPAAGSYNLATRTEDVSLQLPAAALLSEAIGGQNQVLGQVLGNLLNVSLRKNGELGAKNAWKVKASSPLDGPGGEPEEDQIRRGINDLLNIFGG